jgi:hypothetical protein
MVGQWWAGADLVFAEPSNLNGDVAYDFSGGIFSGGPVISHDFDTELSGRIRGGWKDRDPSGNSYSLSWWSWDNDTSLEEGGGVQPIVSDAFFANSFADRVESDMSLKASILDLMVTRRLAATKRSAWFWGFGVRRSEVEQGWSVEYFDAGTPVVGPEESIDISVDSDGLGLTAGIGTTFSWHPRWRTHARAQFALLKGTTDASYTDRGYDTLFTNTFLTTSSERSDDRVFQQIEVEAKVSFTVLTGFEIYLGYWFMNWGDALQVDRFLDDVQGGTASTREDLAFDGIVVGGTFTFE